MTYMNNKLGKYRALSTDLSIARHLPQTLTATENHVRGMLEKVHEVYLKPSHGTGGFGICKLSRLKGGYLLQQGTAGRSFSSFDRAFHAFKGKAGKRTYLVQKSIPLLRWQGRSFDLRVMVQKNRKREWEITGIVGRVAQKGKIVTNYHNGGKPMPVEQILLPLVTPRKREIYMNSLKGLCLHVSQHMGRLFPRFAAFGIDIGIDRKLKPWIIEVNTQPDKYIFNALKDKRMFRQIVRYARYSQVRGKRMKS